MESLIFAEAIPVVATWHTAAPASYYARQTAYYVGGVEPRGRWFAPGGDFGLIDHAEIDEIEFERIYTAVGPDGRSLLSDQGVRADRTPAFEIMYGCPKSVSLAWAFADPDLKSWIELAQDRAARYSLGILEKEAAFARRGKNGSRIEPVRLTAALFQHGESRPVKHLDGKHFPDPNLHTHCVITNLASRADGSIGALHSVILRQWKMAAGAAYHAALASELEAIGFEIDHLGKNGIFELKGVSDREIDYFSGRRAEIVEALVEHGVESHEAAALASAVARATRRGKDGDLSKKREESWLEAGRDLALDVDTFTSSLISDRGPNLTAGERLLSERLSLLPETLTQTTSVIDRQTFFGAVASAFVGTGLPAARIEPEVDRLLANGAVLEIGRDSSGLPRYSTPEMVAIEREIVERAGRLAIVESHGLDLDEVGRRCDNVGLLEEQRKAALSATAIGRISAIQGAPGSGKTTTLLSIVASYKDAGYRVVGASAAWRVANTLKDELDIAARATASWLEGVRHGLPFLDSSTVLVVDEAGLVDSRDMVQVLREVEKTGAKVILVGDPRQLQPLGAGSGFKLVAEAVEAARVDTIVRQHEPWMRDAVRSFGVGDAKDALDAFADHGHVVEAQGASAAVNSIVDHWKTGRAQGAEPLILARTNAQVGEISRAVRKVRREIGELTGPEIDLQAVTPSGQSTRLKLAAGDRFRFLMRDDELGVVNGTAGVITHVEIDDSASDTVTLHADVEGRSIAFDPQALADKKGRVRLGWGYASTVFLAQGTTVDRAIVLLDQGYDRHAVYVAASRARSETRFVIDATAIDQQIATESNELNSSQLEPEARQIWLAERLSRARQKVTTLDFVRSATSVFKDAPDRADAGQVILPRRARAREAVRD